MKLTNADIEGAVNILQSKDAFCNDLKVKLPAKIRYMIRVNESKLVELYNAFVKARADILKRYVDLGYADVNGDELSFDPVHVNEVTKELNDLLMIENDVDLVLVDEKIMDEFLEVTSLSIPEERILRFFTEAPKEKEGDT